MGHSFGKSAPDHFFARDVKARSGEIKATPAYKKLESKITGKSSHEKALGNVLKGKITAGKSRYGGADFMRKSGNGDVLAMRKSIHRNANKERK